MEHLKGGRLIIRADASTQIGTGHVMRCLALAQAWKDADGEAIFITACQNEGLLQRLREEGVELHVIPDSYPDPGDWDYTKGILASHPDAWVALDGYHFDEVYQQQVKEAGHRLLVIDDMAHLKHYYADIVLNQNFGADELHYSCEPYTRLLLGTRYVLLRREFLAWKDWQREIPEVARRVLVTLGGSDPENYTLEIIHALQEIDMTDLEVKVVIGASNPHANMLEAVAKQSRVPIRLIRDTQNMPELMAWADVAISGGGITCWELEFMGVPTLVIVWALNQEASARALREKGIALALTLEHIHDSAEMNRLVRELLGNKQERVAMSRMGRVSVDGQGAQRVLESLRDEDRDFVRYSNKVNLDNL